MPIRIGVLLNSSLVPLWQKSIIEFVLGQPGLELCLVITNKGIHTGGSGRWVYRFLRKLDRAIFKSKHDQFALVDILELIRSAEIRPVVPRQTRYKDELLPDDVEWIKIRKPDILIRFGFRILTGDILQVAKHGVWSLHHGDSAVNRGGPPAFWEVVNRDPITGVTLQILSEKLDAGVVLGKSYCKTDFTSFNRNQNNVFAAGVELFCGRLRDLVRLGPEKFFGSLPVEPSQYAPTLYRDPKDFKALAIGLSFWSRRVREWFIKIFTEEQWIIFYKGLDQLSFSMDGSTSIVPPRGTDWADPFLFKHEENTYLFFENLDKKSGVGKIDCMLLERTERKPIRVLDEPHHLSYPYLVKEKGETFLVAEAAQSKTISLYQSIAFPGQWRKVKDLVTGVACYDPTLFFHEGLWYLFVSQRPIEGASADQYLYIYFSSSLLNGEWTLHPLNPLTRDVRGSRPAGRIFEYEGKLIRPAQIGTPKYGFGIRMQQITKLSPTEYEETPLHDILPWQKNILATHTFNFVDGLMVIDAQRRRFRYF